MESGEGKRRAAVLVRYPIDDPSWKTDLEHLCRQRGVFVFLLASLRDRADAEAEAKSGYAGVVLRPAAQGRLLEALAHAAGHELAKPVRRGPDLSESAKQARGRFKLLLAEDYVPNQKVATLLLARVGYRCDVVDDGAKAVEAAASGAYDLVLMDCQMPVLDGLEATREIRRREAETGARIPIVAMTANAADGHTEDCLAAGMDDFVSKPIHVEKLYEILEKHLQQA